VANGATVYGAICDLAISVLERGRFPARVKIGLEPWAWLHRDLHLHFEDDRKLRLATAGTVVIAYDTTGEAWPDT
jgi:hypothetical protein